MMLFVPQKVNVQRQQNQTLNSRAENRCVDSRQRSKLNVSIVGKVFNYANDMHPIKQSQVCGPHFFQEVL